MGIATSLLAATDVPLFVHIVLQRNLVVLSVCNAHKLGTREMLILKKPWLSQRRLTRGGWFFLRLAISIATFAALYVFSGLAEAAALVARVDLLPAALALALLMLCIPVLAWRWRAILFRLGVTSAWSDLVRILYISSFVGVALPSANGGDLVRGAMLKKPGVQLGTVVSSILIDRLCGLVSMAFLALPGAVLFLINEHDALAIELVAAGSAGFVVLVLASLVAVPRFAVRPCAPSSANAGVMHRLADTIAAAASAFSPRAFCILLLLSLASQILTIAAVVCAAIAIHAAEPLAVYFALVPVIWVVTMLPVTISGLGVREGAFAMLFDAVGLPYAHGIAIGTIVSATTIVAAVLGGGALFFRQPSIAPAHPPAPYTKP